MKMFATMRAGRLCARTATAPTQYRAVKFQAKGPETTLMWTRRGVVLWRK
jgi:hypothetical protein